jgi:hypothetical protein
MKFKECEVMGISPDPHQDVAPQRVADVQRGHVDHGAQAAEPDGHLVAAEERREGAADEERHSGCEGKWRQQCHASSAEARRLGNSEALPCHPDHICGQGQSSTCSCCLAGMVGGAGLATAAVTEPLEVATTETFSSAWSGCLFPRKSVKSPLPFEYWHWAPTWQGGKETGAEKGKRLGGPFAGQEQQLGAAQPLKPIGPPSIIILPLLRVSLSSL